MYNRRRLIMVISFFAISVTAFSQKNFLPGLLVFYNGDTIRGLINYQNWESNPKRIEYRQSVDSKIQTYTPLQLKYIKVYNQAEYIGVTFWITNMPEKPEKIDHEAKVFNVKRTAFLKVITKGQRLTLLELVDARKHYLIKPENDSIRELIYGKISYEYRISTDDTYRKQLEAFIPNSGNKNELKEKIANLEYNRSNLAQIVRAINEDTNTAERSGSAKWKITPYLGAGVTSNKIIFGIIRDLKNLQNTKSPLSYIISGGVDLEAATVVRKLFFRFSLSYSSFSYLGEERTSTEYRRYTLDINSITPAVSANFSIINSKNSSFYVGLGSAYNFSSYPKNEFYFKNIFGSERTNNKLVVPEKGWIEVFGRSGYTYRNFDLQLVSRFKGSFEKFEGPQSVKTRFKTNALILSYRL